MEEFMRGLGELSGLDIVAAAGQAPRGGEPSRLQEARSGAAGRGSLLRAALRRLGFTAPGDARCPVDAGRTWPHWGIAGAPCADHG